MMRLTCTRRGGGWGASRGAARGAIHPGGWVLTLLVLALLFPGLRAAAQEDPPERQLTAEVVERLVEDTVIALDPEAELQWLPNAVREVRTGPDGRQWYALYPAGWTPDAVAEPDVAAIKRAIEGQFAEPAPKVPGVRLALFEPNDRVWFIVEPGELLLGYAGEPGEWIERRAEGERNAFVGAVNGDNNPPGGAANVMVGRHRLSIDSRGVQVFDGEEWSLPSFEKHETKPRAPRLVYFAMEDPSGGVIYHTSNDDFPLWRFHDGEWAPLPLPTMHPSNIRAAVRLTDGRVLLTKKTWNRLGIELLDVPGDDWNNELQAETNPSILLPAASTINLNAPDAAKHIKATTFCPDGTVLLAVEGIREGDHWVNGVAVLVPGGDPSAVPVVSDWEVAASVGSLEPVEAAWIKPSRLYLPGSISTESLTDYNVDLPGVLHFALDHTAFVPLQDPAIRRLFTVNDAGTLFVGGPWVESPKLRNRPIAVLRSDPPVGEAEAFELRWSKSPLAASPDGSIWTLLEDGTLSRFDGKLWHGRPLDLPDFYSGIYSLVVGSEGVMLVIVQEVSEQADEADEAEEAAVFAHVLVRGDETFIELDPRRLIANHADTVRESFKHNREATLHFNDGPAVLDLLIDSGNRIWLIRRSGVDVLADGTWHEVLSQRMDGAAILGDGRDIMLFPSEWEATTIAGWREGKVQVRPIEMPEPDAKMTYHVPTRSPDGSVWFGLERYVRDPQGTAQHLEFHSVRVTPDGESQILRHVGWPRLIEADGTVWLGGSGKFIGDGYADEFAVWRDGRIVQRLTVPRADRASRFLSVKPGSVWVWSNHGLRHLLADDPAAPGRYRVGRLFRPTANGRPFNITFFLSGPRMIVSPRGYIAVMEDFNRPYHDDRPRIGIIRLYEHADEAADPDALKPADP